MAVAKQRTDARTIAIPNSQVARDLKEAAQIADVERRYRAARRAQAQNERKLARLRGAAARLIEVAQGREIGSLPLAAKPSELVVPGFRELVVAIQAMSPWFGPPEAYIRGATDEDAPEITRLLIALERGHPFPAACRLAAAAGVASRDRAEAILRMSRAGVVDKIRKAATRSDACAYPRWLAGLRGRRVRPYADESRAEWEARARRHAELLAIHDA